MRCAAELSRCTVEEEQWPAVRPASHTRPVLGTLGSSAAEVEAVSKLEASFVI